MYRRLLPLAFLALFLFVAACEDEDCPVGSGPIVTPNPEGRLYVPNQADQTIFIYDSKTLQRLDSISTPVVEPHFVQFSPDYLYYYIIGRQVGGQVAKYRTSDNQLIQTITVPTVGNAQVFPTSLVVSNDGQTVFLTDFSNAAGFTHRYRASGTEFSWLGTDSLLQAGVQTHDIRISDDGKYVISAGYNSDDITVYNTETGDLYPLTLDSAKQVFNPPSGAYGPYGVLIDHNSTMAVIACRKGTDQLRLIDLRNNTILDSILIPVDDGAEEGTRGPTYMTLLPDNNTLFVTSHRATEVYVVKLATREIVETIDFETPFSFGISSSDDGSRVYVSCTNTRPNKGRVYVIDGSTYQKIDSITVGSEPFGLIWTPPVN